ncbi:hypothetical protein [Erwinia aphidicola]|uniref:hypothetical protein n=1 Tax=Erwinia aphidicola TaxID=68334 RepID=UPI00209EC427|nr:hypothetical protein [Erwinia aphidicola]MCP2234085.1 hypothetical protein [Erwinia aphidicola]
MMTTKPLKDPALLNDARDVLNELSLLRHRLMEENCHRLDGIARALALIEGMMKASHPSGYPDPDDLDYLARLLREEKFREKREKQRATQITTCLQSMIDTVKALTVRARLARPPKEPQYPWDGGMLAQIFTMMMMVPVFLLLAVLAFIDISDTAKAGIMVGYLIVNIILAVALKNCVMLIIMALILLLSFFFTLLLTQFHPQYAF